MDFSSILIAFNHNDCRDDCDMYVGQLFLISDVRVLIVFDSICYIDWNKINI